MFSNIGHIFSGNSAEQKEERERLKAFLAAFPGEYFAVSNDGTVLYSPDLPEFLGEEDLQNIEDIQNTLSPSDSAALQTMAERLSSRGKPFHIPARLLVHEKDISIMGARGAVQKKGESKAKVFYDVLWFTEAARPVPKVGSDVRDNRSQYEIMLDVIPRAVWMRDENQNLTWCNQTYAEIAKLPLEEVVLQQKEIANPLRPKKNGTDIRELAARALKTGNVQEKQLHSIIQGKRVLMKISEIPAPDKSMTVGIAYNITREEELESEMKRYQASNQELLEQLRTAIAIYDADTKLEFYNSAFAQLWDLEDKWLNKRPDLGMIMEKLRETRRLPEQADFRKYKKSWLDMFTRLIDPHEDMLHLPDGSALRMLVVPHSMGGLMMTFEDVTSSLELESSYNTLIAVQKETLDNLAEAVAVYGGDGRLKLYNPSFQDMWSFNPEDLEGEPHISKLVEKQKQFFDANDETKRREKLIAMGLNRVTHDGRFERLDERLIDFSTVPLPDGGIMITYTDVTDSARVEHALREKYAALEAAERVKLDFLANVSYQLRTPLNAIIGFNDILDQEYFGMLNNRQKEYTRDIGKAGQRLMRLINNILDLSTLEAGVMDLEKSDVKIYPMLHDIIDLVAEWARKKQIEVHLKCPKNIGSVSLDQRRVQQAIVNLIRNSIAFTKKGGEIYLIARKEDDRLRISVSDTGIGIAKEDTYRVFEPFERAKSGANAPLKRTGAGLGLPLVKKIVTLHGGTIELESEPERGTTVTLFIPINTAPQVDLNIPAQKKNKKSKKENASA